jgi:release factor glutamine methyltransferase
MERLRRADTVGAIPYTSAATDREARATSHGPIRRALRAAIHFVSYHLVLARQSTRRTRVAGFRLEVRPTVFHPRYFISSECFAGFIDRLDLAGKHVADVGTGTGILALAAARAGAARVTALDINPNAALNAAANARANGFTDRVDALCSNLFSALPAEPMFDVILSSPPKHAGEPRDLADRGWHAGPRYRDIAALFEQARERLKPGGRVYVMVSSDSDIALLVALMERAGFRVQVVHEHSLYIESMIIYELRVERDSGASGAGRAKGSMLQEEPSVA